MHYYTRRDCADNNGICPGAILLLVEQLEALVAEHIRNKPGA